MTRWIWLLFLSCPLNLLFADSAEAPSALCPENVRRPGHSMQGESFDEGPRHAATLLGTTGRVTFPITTRVPLAQQFFNQGVGQLHGYWYFEAERSFRQAAKLDPECAMTYYGMALANTNNEQRAKGFLAEALARKVNASEREMLYVEALNTWYQAKADDKEQKKVRVKDYCKSIEEILYRFPEDLEAKALLCRVLVQHEVDGGSTGSFPIDALIGEVLAINPFHPAHHYRIHLWDNEKAKLAIQSAERCGLSAPGIAHMWHMSGHTYSELHQYFDAAWHQEAAARTDHAYMMREMIFPDRIHNFAHNNEWLAKNLQYLGRIRDAISIARNAIELPQHPKWNPLPGDKSADFGRLRLFQIYSNFELWDQLIADCQSQFLVPTSNDKEQVKYHRLLGRAYFARKDVELGKGQLALLEERLLKMKSEAQKEGDGSKDATQRKETNQKNDDSKRDEELKEKTKALENAIAELHGLHLLSEGKPDAALESLQKAQGVDEALLAQVEYQAGRPDESLKRLRDWKGRNKNQVRPLAAVVEMEWRQGRKDEAVQTFRQLREISGSIDLDVPQFARLKPIAEGLGYAGDWRLAAPVRRNAAELPDLSTLGPLTWQPSLAPNWLLEDSSGGRHSLNDYRGRPVIVIFYLGYGCLHCAEQLKQFVSRLDAFREAGISLVAISSDNVTNLKKSESLYQTEGKFPIRLLSDSSYDTFKAYRAYDDFEESPLHATILIDGDGKMRWHDVGAEPFMELDFLLDEAKRLLYPAK